MIQDKIKVYFCQNGGMKTEDLLRIYAKQTPDSDGQWGRLIGTTDIKSADFFIVQDETSEEIPDLSRVIFFGREPRHYRYYGWDRECYAKFHHDEGTSWVPVTWWVDLPFRTLEAMSYDKTKLFSVVDSGKKSLEGHRKRVSFIKSAFERYHLDVFGKINGNVLPPRDKQAALLEYYYHLAIENGQTDYYFSEKICDPLLCLAKPFYFGARKIEQFFPSESYLPIDVNDFDRFDEILESIGSINIDSLKEARNLILYKYNIWPTLEMAIFNRKIL